VPIFPGEATVSGAGISHGVVIISEAVSELTKQDLKASQERIVKLIRESGHNCINDRSLTVAAR
jgi:hypothetical protein